MDRAAPALIVSTAELAARLSDPALVVVDVRHDLAAPDTWGEAQYRAAHIPGARFAHLDRDLSGPKTGHNGRHPLPSPEAAAATFGRLGIDATKEVVAVDQGASMYAARLWWMLRWLGHESVAVLDGGFAKWLREGRPVTTEVPSPSPSSFAIHGVGRTIDADTLVRNLSAPDYIVVDSRSPERWRGAVEPIDPVAGSIPDSRNRPMPVNFAADGTFRDPRELHREFEALLAGANPDRVVHQCGSGVAAAASLLAMEIAGLSGSLLYPGSWSEWCADPSRPVARGDPPSVNAASSR